MLMMLDLPPTRRCNDLLLTHLCMTLPPTAWLVDTGPAADSLLDAAWPAANSWLMAAYSAADFLMDAS